MIKAVSASLTDISDGAQWRGYFDGLNVNGTLYGWAFIRTDPSASLELDLHIRGIHLATATANRPRPDIDKALGLQNPARTGFAFDLKTCRPKGSLEFLRKFGCSLPEVSILNELRICIAGTPHALPAGGKNKDVFFALAPHLNALVGAAAAQLRSDIASGKQKSDLSAIDYEILLRSNPLFSGRWYADTYEDVRMIGIDPGEHYLKLSLPLGRSSGPWFDSAGYLAAAPEARKTELPPVVHYDLYGHDRWWPGLGRFRVQSPEPEGQSDYALLIHLGHLDTVPDLQRLITSFPDDVDVFVSIPDESPDHDPGKIAAMFPRAREILTVPNRGHDVAAFLETVRRLKGRGYRFFCKAHSRKGNRFPDIWRRVMFDALAATPQRVAETVGLFRSEPRVLMAGPAQFWLNGEDFGLDNTSRLEEFTARLGFGDGALNRDWAFFAGACFWIDAELAGLVADAVSADDFAETQAAPCEQTMHAVERLFCLVATMAGGRTALIDGCDWMAAPALPDAPVDAGLRLAGGEDPGCFLARHLRELAAPRTIDGTAARPGIADPGNIFGTVDIALHGAIDVLISCWIGRHEILHEGLARLARELNHVGLTWGGLVGTPLVRDVFLGASCANVALDSLYLRFPDGCGTEDIPDEAGILPDEFALSLLRSEHMFLNTTPPKDAALQAALAHIRKLYAYWRATLLRHKVKMFLIWGTTAPKSRLFIRLCQELGIEYQIIERGHFPGTLSLDPMGQFGTGVHPRLIGHAAIRPGKPAALDARFAEIRDWYESQQDNAAYTQFQKRDTRDLEIMRRARRYGRPVILVIGGNDQGSGVVGPDSDALRLNWFESSDNAFTLIQRLVSSKFSDALLVLRPHPSQKLQEGMFALIARQTALNDLIENADICITIATTASAFCLLKEKALLTLGLSELNGQAVGEAIVDETHLLAALRQHIWSDFADPYPDSANRRFIADLFDRHLVGVDRSVPTRYDVTDLARLVAGRIQQMKTGFLHDYAGREEKISQAMFEDVRDRGRAIFPVDPRALAGRTRPPISVVLPIYGDYEGTRICFDQLVRHQEENGYRVITVWDRGPDLRLRDLCLEYAGKAGFTYLENIENVGFSGTVNRGILHSGRDDVILLNSDTVPCGDWALRLQDAAYAHPKIAASVPFSNNATIYSVPFPQQNELPETDPVGWVEGLDRKARAKTPYVVEMPISHGYCTYVRRSTFDRIGLYSETKFDKGHGEDNEFSMRVRSAGYFCGCATQVFVGHAGSTSFAEDAMKWKLAGRESMQKEFTHYFEEVLNFIKNDPIYAYRRSIIE